MGSHSQVKQVDIVSNSNDPKCPLCLGLPSTCTQCGGDGSGHPDIKIDTNDIVGLPVKGSQLLGPDGESIPGGSGEGLPIVSDSNLPIYITDRSEKPREFVIPQCDTCTDSPLHVTAQPTEKPYTFTLGYECPKCKKSLEVTNKMSLDQWFVCALFETTFNLRNHVAEHDTKEPKDE